MNEEAKKRQQVPWFRIGAEAVAIIASILIAFAIDAWWDQNKDRDLEQEYIQALHAEFSAVSDEITADYDRRQQRVDAYTWLLQAISGSQTEPEDSVRVRLSLLTGMARFLAPHTVYDDLVASGGFRLLRSSELRFALLEYGSQADRLRWSEERLNAAYFQGIYPYLLEETDWLAWKNTLDLEPVHSWDVDDLLLDREFQNILVGRLEQLGGTQRETLRLRDIVERVLGLLEAEIG
jgi:hypothetical protein